MKVVRIPRRLKKVIKNFLNNNPRAVYYTSKHHVAYIIVLRSGRLRMVWFGSPELEEEYERLERK